MKQRNFFLFCIFLFLSGCAGFVQPAIVKVDKLAAAPVVPAAETPTNSRAAKEFLEGDGPTDGYLRLFATTNMSGISYSWSDGKARSKFKKLLVSATVGGTTTEIPIMSLDVTGKNPAASTKTDVDIARLMRVTLDKNKTSGSPENPTYSLVIDAVPITLADAADAVATYANKALEMLPPGTNIAATFTTGGTAELVKGLISTIGSEAQAYKNKSWRRSIEASLQSALASNNGRVDWILCPDPDNANPQATTDPDNPPKTCNNLPQLYACAQDGSQQGVLSSICVKDSTGNLKVYTDYAWISLRFELMDSPGTNVIPNFTCQDIKDTQKVSKWTSEAEQYNLTPVHNRQLSWYSQKLTSLNNIFNHDGAAKYAAFLEWNAGSDSETDTEKTTWSDLYTKSDSLDKCLGMYIKGTPRAKVLSIETAKLYELMKSLNAIDKDSVADIYNAVVSINMVLGDKKVDGDISELVEDKNALEEALYQTLTKDSKTDQERKIAVADYPRCSYCQDQVANVKIAGALQPTGLVVGATSYGQLAIEKSLQSAGLDTTPLNELKKLDEKIVANQKGGKNIDKLLQARDKKVEEASKVIGDGLGVDEARIKAFLGTPNK